MISRTPKNGFCRNSWIMIRSGISSSIIMHQQIKTRGHKLTKKSRERIGYVLHAVDEPD